MTRLIKITDTIADRPSPIKNVIHKTACGAPTYFTNNANNHATGTTNKNWRSTDMISDAIPSPNAWKQPCIAIFVPANKKLKEIILIALTQRDAVSPDNPKKDVNILAKISKTIKPIAIIINV